MHTLRRFILILIVVQLTTLRSAALGYDPKREAVKPASPKAGTQETAVIIVNERVLVGTNSAPQVRGGRLFLPIATIAEALGDTFSSDSTQRMVTIRRQDGIVAIFNAPLNEVRENGAVILTLSGSADLVFPPTPNELMLPAEIVAALLDVTIRRDENNAIVVTRKGVQAETIRTGAKHAPWEIFQLEYDYNYSRYTSLGDHSLVLHGTGRVGDARLSFVANTSIGVLPNSSRPSLTGGTIRLDRPNGQTFVGGEFGTGTDVEFLASAVRGGLVQLPFDRVRLDFFGGQTTSGVPQLLPTDASANAPTLKYSALPIRYDTPIFGAIVTTSSQTQRQPDFTFSAGGMHFGGESRRGDLIAGGLKYQSGVSRFQADVAAGQFSGVNRNGTETKGSDFALTVSGSHHLTDQIVLQGRYAYVGQMFLSPQTGLHEPTNAGAGGVSWQPLRWFSAALSGSTASTPGRAGQFNRYITATVNLAPDNALPSLFFSHTQSGTTQLRSSAFTLITATKKFNHWSMFFNGSRVKTFGNAALNAQIGGNLRINEWNTLEVSQSVGSRGLFSGMTTWQVSNLLHNRIGLSAGLGYTRSDSVPLHTSEYLSGSIKLPRNSSLQFSYLKTQTGTTALISLHGLFFSSKRAERAMNGPLTELNSYGAVYGRVFQDVNLNGRFDAGIDQPQANARVRVDGNRYVVSDANGNFRIDSVARGDHSVYLDLLSVRADLTLLDNTQQLITMDSRRDVILDFRVVRTGRITGVVWLDANGNGRLDEGEQPLADVRVVTGSGRDTLTDDKGYFIIGDLPPGEHILLLDEKTIPEQTRSVAGSQSIKVAAGNETAIIFPVVPLPDQIKKFP
jgi:copper amine oxidase-like protein